MTTQVALVKGSGRPRSPEVNQRVIEAVLELVAAGTSLNALSLVDIAQSSGISRNSIYRRWKSKDDILFDVVKSMRWTLPEVVQLSARENLITLMVANRERVSDPRLLRFERAINAEEHHFSELHAYYRAEIFAPWTHAVKAVVRRGKETGEIRIDVDETLLVEVLDAAILARLNSVSFDRDAATIWIRAVTDLTFDGVARS